MSPEHESGRESERELDADWRPDPVVVTWVAGPGAAWSAAYSITITELRGPRFVAFAASVLLGLPLLLALTAHDGPVVGILVGLVLGLLAVTVAVVISAWDRHRRYRRVFAPGRAVRCRFDDDRVTFLGDYSESTFRFEGFNRLREVDEWLLIRGRGGTTELVMHRALVPPDVLARLRLTVLGVAGQGQ